MEQAFTECMMKNVGVYGVYVVKLKTISQTLFPVWVS